MLWGLTSREIQDCSRQLLNALSPAAGEGGTETYSPDEITGSGMTWDDALDYRPRNIYDYTKNTDGFDRIFFEEGTSGTLRRTGNEAWEGFKKDRQVEADVQYDKQGELLRFYSVRPGYEAALGAESQAEELRRPNAGGSGAYYPRRSLTYENGEDTDGAVFSGGPERAYENAVGSLGTQMGRISDFFRRDSRRYDAMIEKY